MTDPAVPLSEYASRRQRILSVIKKGVAVVFSGEMQGEDFHVHPNFEYLSGISDEPGAALLLDGGARGAESAQGRPEKCHLAVGACALVHSFVSSPHAGRLRTSL